ncbi:hypothetical protein F5Y01DRAFT_300522 [Xylaria sp. FL0043]|nr:hypothetical protein F5Y01DRAFT_300522 [Xylaria sp. FL0043]
MSTTSACPVEEAGLPSYEELKRAHQWVRFPAGSNRFVWHLDGPLPSSIWVRETNDKKAPMEPYCPQTETGTTWHPISQMPLTEPKISSITVHVYDLKQWEETWVESHGREWTWDSDDEELPEGIKYGPIPNYSPETDW